jgi:SSS family solute:Na+ symporter/sodium/pantothenate symporter
VPDARACANWLSTIILLGLASVVYPQAIQRIYAARDGTALKRSFALMSWMPLTTTAVVTLIGLAAIPRFADLGNVEADRVMPLLLGAWSEAGTLAAAAAVLVLIGALAAIMSTADSVLLSLGSIAVRDLVPGERSQEQETRLGKRIAAGALFVLVLAAMNREITLWRLIELKMELLIQCVPAFMLAIHWRGVRAGPALAGLIVGGALAVGAMFGGATRIGGFHTGVISLALNLAITALGSLYLNASRTSSPPYTSTSGAGSK